MEYNSSGKQYNGEKAVISLTSWKARIDTVSKTLFSLIKQCPGFHVVLVLSEDEFKKGVDELPNSLKLFIKNNLIEILWVKKNFKSFKIIFTMDKYNKVPIISADDDCLYKFNYAEELYNKWLENKNCVITYKSVIHKGIKFQHGPSTLYPPDCFRKYMFTCLKNKIVRTNHDDVLYGIMLQRLNIKIFELNAKPPYVFHDCLCALSHNKVMTCQTAIDVIQKEI